MSEEIILDAAFPPTPALWVGDMNAVGASGGCVYVLGPFTNYTPAHVTLARASGKSVIPIVVPGDNPPSYGTVWAALLNYGFSSGPVVFDLERFSEPPDAWLTGARSFLGPLGYLVDRYGTVSELGKYSPENADWIASWLRQGILDPIPSLPAGRVAWQFVDDIVINGRTYDASVMDSSFLGGIMANGFTDDDRAMLSRLATDFFDGQQSTTPDGKSPVPTDWPNFVPATLNQILAGVENLEKGGTVTIDTAPIVNAINSLGGQLTALSTQLTRIENAFRGA